MAKVEHFEIPADDVGRARSFYGDVFGFTFEAWDEDNVMLYTGSPDGINGDIHKRGPVPHPTIVITVDRIEDTLAAVVQNGGEAIGEIIAMGDNARYAYFRDSEGNVVGVYDTTDS